jgi:hypothetical protein
LSQRPNIVVVDQFYQAPLDVRRRALRAAYGHPKDLTGWRSEPYLPRGIKPRLERLLNVRISGWLEDQSSEAANGSFFCAFARGARAETPEVHWDGPASMCAGVVYLTPDAPLDTGTSFWRHKATGLCTAPTPADAARMGLTVKDLEAWIERDSTKRLAFEEIDRIGNQFNRAVFFMPNLLHSATRHFGGGVHKGRLYQLFHFDVAPRSARAAAMSRRP